MDMCEYLAPEKKAFYQNLLNFWVSFAAKKNITLVVFYFAYRQKKFVFFYL